MDKRSFLFGFVLITSFFLLNNYFFYQEPQKEAEKARIEKTQQEEDARILTVATYEDRAEYYVLENETLQVVFSASDGAIAEINLPFKNADHPKSIVHSIEFDQAIEKNYTPNARFPLSNYKIVEGGEVIRKEPSMGGYTPLLRRSLLKSNNGYLYRMPSKFFATALVSSDLEAAPLSFQVSSFDSKSITFTSGGITKRYTLVEGSPYTLNLEITTARGSGRNFWLSTGFPEVELLSGAYSPLMQTYTSNGRKGKIVKMGLPKTRAQHELHPDWISNSNGFFGMILDPLSPVNDGVITQVVLGKDIPSRLTLIDSDYNTYPAANYPGYQIFLPSSGENETVTWNFFAGPFDVRLLEKVDKALGASEGRNPHFEKAVTMHGWFAFILEPISKVLFLLMRFFYFITHSWGISIILLALALRVILYPLNTWSYKSTLKMQKIAPKVTALQEKHKNDPERQRMEMAMLYKNEKANPFAGCLIFLIQIPFLFGMLDLLKTSFVLRGASFIPGWIDNLTAPDTLFCWGHPIFFLGSCFHLLPFILGPLMYLQQKMGTKQQGNKPLSDQQQQMQKIGNIMTIAFTFFFYNMPSGLNIYWIFSTIFGVLQQWLIMKKQGSRA